MFDWSSSSFHHEKFFFLQLIFGLVLSNHGYSRIIHCVPNAVTKNLSNIFQPLISRLVLTFSVIELFWFKVPSTLKTSMSFGSFCCVKCESFIHKNACGARINEGMDFNCLSRQTKGNKYLHFLRTVTYRWNGWVSCSQPFFSHLSHHFQL